MNDDYGDVDNNKWCPHLRRRSRRKNTQWHDIAHKRTIYVQQMLHMENIGWLDKRV